MVEKGNVEPGVVNDDVGALHEADKFVNDLGEQRLVAEKRPTQPVNLKGTVVDLTLGVDVFVKVTTGQFAVYHLDRTDLDHPVALLGLEPGRFRI